MSMKAMNWALHTDQVGDPLQRAILILLGNRAKEEDHLTPMLYRATTTTAQLATFAVTDGAAVRVALDALMQRDAITAASADRYGDLELVFHLAVDH